MARRQQWDLVCACLVGEYKGYACRTRNDERRACRTLPLEPFVAFQSSIGCIPGLAFFEHDLDTIDAAISLIHELVIVYFSIGIRHTTYSVHSGSINKHRYKLLALSVSRQGRGEHPKCDYPRQMSISIHWTPLTSPVHLVDDLIRAEKCRLWNRHSEFLSYFQIYDEMKLGRLLNRKIIRFGAFEQAIDVSGCTTL